MAQEIWIPACIGRRIDVSAGQKIAVIDVRGRTGGRLFAECTDNPEEFLSTAVTIGCNESLRLKAGSSIPTSIARCRASCGTMRGGIIYSSPAAGGKTKTFSIGTAKGIPTAMTTSTDTWSDAVPASGR